MVSAINTTSRNNKANAVWGCVIPSTKSNEGLLRADSPPATTIWSFHVNPHSTPMWTLWGGTTTVSVSQWRTLMSRDISDLLEVSQLRWWEPTTLAYGAMRVFNLYIRCTPTGTSWEESVPSYTWNVADRWEISHPPRILKPVAEVPASSQLIDLICTKF